MSELVVWLRSWWHRLGSPQYFYRFSGTLLPWLAWTAAILLAIGTVWGLLFAPPDAVQGNSYRIIFLHVPVTFITLSNYVVMSLAAVIVLVWRMKLAAAVLFAAAPLGVALSLVVLLSGAVWGKPTWGAWWVWGDARLMSMLVLFFIYLGLTVLRQAYGPVPAAARACALLSLIGSVDVLIVHKSVDWWYSLHQPATIRVGSAPSMHADMWYPLALMILGFYLYYGLILLQWVRNEVLRGALGTSWLRQQELRG